jgi:hypothetical protein
MSLQDFVGPWALFRFVILYTVGRTPCTGISPSQGRYLHTDLHASNGIRTPVFEREETVHALDGTAIVNGYLHFYYIKISYKGRINVTDQRYEGIYTECLR